MPRADRSKQPLGQTLDGWFSRFLRRAPQQARSRALVDAVVEAADELLRRGAPIEEVTIERVSERAGVGMGSFYEYFASKDSVFGALIIRATRANFDELSQKLDALEHDSLPELTRAFASAITETYLAHPGRMRVIIEGVGRLRLSRIVSAEKDRFADAVLAERAAKLLPGESREALAETMRLVADAAMGVLVFAALRGGDVDRKQIADDVRAITLAIVDRRHSKPDTRASD